MHAHVLKLRFLSNAIIGLSVVFKLVLFQFMIMQRFFMLYIKQKIYYDPDKVNIHRPEYSVKQYKTDIFDEIKLLTFNNKFVIPFTLILIKRGTKDTRGTVKLINRK